jgi:hypothetical protein
MEGIMRIVAVVMIFVSFLLLTGCTSTQKGMAIGGLGGAAAGGAIGYFAGDSKTDDLVSGALIGAATGAVAGAVIGYFSGE